MEAQLYKLECSKRSDDCEVDAGKIRFFFSFTRCLRSYVVFNSFNVFQSVGDAGYIGQLCLHDDQA